MKAIDILREKLEKSGWTILSLQELNQRFKNIHTGEDAKVVFEYRVRDGVGSTFDVYVLGDGDTWQVGQFNANWPLFRRKPCKRKHR